MTFFNRDFASPVPHHFLRKQLEKRFSTSAFQGFSTNVPLLAPSLDILCFQSLTKMSLPLSPNAARDLAGLLHQGKGEFFSHLKTLAIRDCNDWQDNVKHEDFVFGNEAFQTFQVYFQDMLKEPSISKFKS